MIMAYSNSPVAGCIGKHIRMCQQPCYNVTNGKCMLQLSPRTPFKSYTYSPQCLMCAPSEVISYGQTLFHAGRYCLQYKCPLSEILGQFTGLEFTRATSGR